MVLAEKPDVAVIATGSQYSRQGITPTSQKPIPGHDLKHVLVPEEVIGGEPLHGKVVVIDDEGLHTASGIAEMLATKDCKVVYVARKQTVGASLGIAIGYVNKRLRGAGVKVITGHIATAITPNAVNLYDVMAGEASVEEGVDFVVLSTSREPVDALYGELDGKVPYVYLVGDALAPRALREATYEGHRFGRVIGDPNMPATVMDELFRMDPAAALVSAANAGN